MNPWKVVEVSKSRGKSVQLPPGAEANEPTRGESQNAFSASPVANWGIALGVAALAVAYLALFVSASQTRLLVIAYLLVPEELASQWAEGHWNQARFMDRLPILLFGSVILLGCYFLGRLFLWAIQFDRVLTHLERTVFSFGIGLQLQSLFTLLTGLLALPWRSVALLLLWIISAGSILALWWLGKLRYEPIALADNLPTPTESVAPTSLALVATWSLRIYVVLCSLAILLGAMLPPVDFDVREYHLQAPKEWNESGRITFLPHNVYGNMPLGAELHSLTATQLMPPVERRWWWGALTGKLLMGTYAPLTALAVYAMGKRFLSPLAGLAAAAIYVSSPWVVHISVNGLNEVVLGYYLLTAVYALLISPRYMSSVIVAGFFAGAAASCKYTGVVFVILPVAILAFVISAVIPRWNASKGMSSVSALLIVAAMSCGLWYGKNWVLTGNPTYPLLFNVFGGQTWNPEKNARWTEAHKPRAFSWENLSESTQDILWKNSFHDPLSVPLATLGLVGISIAVRKHRRNPESKSEVFYAEQFPLVATVAILLFFVVAWWFSTHRLIRFLVPAFPLAALLAGAGVEYAKKRQPLLYVIAGLMFVGLTYNLLSSASAFVGDNRWFVALDRLRFDEPEREKQLSRVKLPHRWLNIYLKPNEAVLCVGDASVFDLEMPVFYNTCFDDCLLVNWTEGKTIAERKEELRRRKIAYVYFDTNEYGRYIAKGNYGYDPRFSPQLLDELVTQGVLKPPLADAPGRIYPVAP